MTTKVKLIAAGVITPSELTLTTASAGTNTVTPATTAFVQQELTSGLAPKSTIASPTFTGTPSAPTAAGNTTTTQLATTAFVQQEITTLIGGAPSTLNDLNELAAAINDDANYNSTLTTALATKLPLAGGTLTGTLNVGSSSEVIIASSGSSLFPSLKVNNNGYVGSASVTDALQFQTNGDIKAKTRFGVNVTPVGNNFALQVVGLGASTNDARTAKFVGSSNHTTIGGTGPTIVLANANSTVNNITKLSFETASAGEAVSLNVINTNHSSFYGDFAINTRGSDGYSEKLRVMANGNVGIGTTNPASKLHISGNSDVSDEDCQLIIEDVDGSTGSRIPSIQFRSFTSNTVTNQGRIRATDTQGMIFSGSSAQGDDLVVKAGKVGVGMIPVEVLDLKADSGDTRLRLDAVSGSDTEIKFFNAGAAQYTIGHDDATDNFVIGTINVDTPLVSISKAGNISLNGGGIIEAPSVGGGEPLTLKAAGGITAIIDSNGNGGDGEFFRVQKHTGDNLLTVQETGAVEVTGTLNANGTLSATASVGVNQLFKSTYNYGSNRDWAFRTNNYGSSNWGGWSLEQSGEQQGTPDIARIGVHANGNVGIRMGGHASSGLTTVNPATALHVGGDITVGTAESVGTGAAAAIRFVNDNERARITSNYAAGGGGQMGFWTDSTGGTLLQRAYIKNNGEVNLQAGLRLNGYNFGNSDVFKTYYISGPSTSTITRTINVNTYFGFTNGTGGYFMMSLHGWQTDSAAGLIHWHNAGGSGIMTSAYFQPFYTPTGLTVSVAKGTGDYDIDITLTGTHSNTHGWRMNVWG